MEECGQRRLQSTYVPGDVGMASVGSLRGLDENGEACAESNVGDGGGSAGAPSSWVG